MGSECRLDRRSAETGDDWLIERASIRAGDVVFDLAAGPGGVGHAAAPLVLPEGRVLSTDLAPAITAH